MDRALAMEDIRDRICSFSEISDTARFTQLSRSWHEPALNHTWHTVTGLQPLLSVLAPMEEVYDCDEGEDFVRFARRVSEEDWVRFALHARRVKVLHMTCPKDTPRKKLGRTLDESIFKEVAGGRPPFPILPNLQELWLYQLPRQPQWMLFAEMLLYKGLRSLHLVTMSAAVMGSSATPVGEIIDFLIATRYRSPYLLALDLHIRFSIELFGLKLPSVLSRLTELRDITISSCGLTGNVISSLSTLQELKTIKFGEFQMEPDLIDDTLPSAIDFGGSDPERRFPKLEELDLQGPLPDMNTFLIARPLSSSALRSLRIDMTHVNLSEDIKECLSILSNSFSSLSELSFTRSQDNGWEHELLEEGSPITLDVLRSLSSFPQLTVFVLECTQAVDMADEELCDVIEDCSKLKVLRFNPEPITQPPTRLTLGLLARLAFAGTRLEDFRIRVDCRNTDNLPKVPHRIFLPHLQKLEFGTSPISNPDEVALFLGKVLPLTCDLSTDWPLIRRVMETIHREGFHVLRDEWKLWKTVKRRLPLLIRARRED